MTIKDLIMKMSNDVTICVYSHSKLMYLYYGYAVNLPFKYLEKRVISLSALNDDVIIAVN